MGVLTAFCLIYLLLGSASKAQETDGGDCPDFGCDLACSNGFQTGADGCEICECNLCPQVRCAISCDNGFKTDSNGCLICECDEDTDRCPALVCEDDCQYGRIVGEDGCLSCDCRENPCQCEENQVCVINADFEWKCIESPGENEMCEREDKEDKDRSGSKSGSNSVSGSKSQSNSQSTSNTNGTRENSKSEDKGKNSLSEKLLRLLSSKSEKEEEKEERRSITMANRGAASRNILRNIETTPDSCRPGFFCEETSDSYGICSPIRKEGPCYNISQNPEEECDDTGYFKLRLCYENDEGDTECVCVDPETGTRYEDTRTIIDDDDDKAKLNCIDRAFDSCAITYDDRVYNVKHGRRHFDRCNCRVCTCYFGELFCEDSLSAGCRGNGRCSNSSGPSSCSLQNGAGTIEHGESVEDDCNRCFCRNGRLICTKYPVCGNSGDDCEQCKSERISKVCGPNGRTYPNLCTAVNCAGWDPMELLDGPCASHNPCVRFPCESGEICLRRGGVSCLAQGGCDPSDVRACVNITRLPCDFTTTSNPSNTPDDDGLLGSGDIDPDNTAVCGSDGNSYPAICHIIPNYPRVYVVHAGQCDDFDCRGGSVCGSDGVTYENICALRSQSSNARVDYRGDCIESNGTVEEYCRAVTEEGLCEHSINNCDNLVQPTVGCCPICGSVIILLLDLEALQDAAMIDPSLITLDDLVGSLLEAEFFTNLFDRCSFEGLLTHEGHAEIIVRPQSSDDVSFCNTEAERIVGIINSGGTSTGRKRQSDDNVQLTSTYQYVLEADISASTTDDEGSSATIVSAAITTIVFTAALFTLIV